MNYTISTLDSSVEINIHEYMDDFKQFEFWVNNFIPLAEISTKKNEAEKIIECVYGNEPSIYFESQNKIVLTNKWERGVFPADIAKLISQLLQPKLNESGVFTFPSSAVSINESAILYVADYWQGKTSCSVATIERIENSEFISSGRVVVKDDIVLGGSRHIEFMPKNVENYKIVKGLEPIYELSHRVYYRIGKGNTINNKIKAIIVPQINDSGNDIHLIDKNEATWYLFNKASNLIRGEALLFNYSEPSPGFDSVKLSKMRLNWIKSLIEKVPVIYISGSVDKITKLAESIANNEFKI